MTRSDAVRWEFEFHWKSHPVDLSVIMTSLSLRMTVGEVCRDLGLTQQISDHCADMMLSKYVQLRD